LRRRALSEKQIYFFEPDPILFQRLQSNIARNGLNCIEGHNIAVADSVGKAVFFRNQTDDNSGSLIQEDWSKHTLEPIEVEKTSFHEFATTRNLARVCAKVDIEGAEELFFEGAKSSLGKLSYLIMEILGPAIHRGFPLRLISEGKLQAYYINDYELEHSVSGEYRYRAPFYNWLFCKDTPGDLRHKLADTPFRVSESRQPA
jgi:FkbM family methyltransferase